MQVGVSVCVYDLNKSQHGSRGFEWVDVTGPEDLPHRLLPDVKLTEIPVYCEGDS